jgi:hypothetical protein
VTCGDVCGKRDSYEETCTIAGLGYRSYLSNRVGSELRVLPLDRLTLT